MTTIINCCDHPIAVRRDDGKYTTFKPSGNVVRVHRVREGRTKILGFNIFKRGNIVVNLPQRQKDTLYLVSRIVIEAVYREDLIAPQTYSISKYLFSLGSLLAVKNLIMRTKP